MSYSTPVTRMVLLLLVAYLPVPPSILSQSLGNSPSSPTVAQCGPRLLPLTSCAPFVQGRSPLPLQQCCDNLGQLSAQQPGCLCLLLNGTTLTSLPINTTRAMQLPLICNLQANISICSGVPVPVPVPPTPQVSFGTTNSTVAASPMDTLTPRPNVMGFGFRPSAGVKLKLKAPLLMAVLIIMGVAKACMSTNILS